MFWVGNVGLLLLFYVINVDIMFCGYWVFKGIFVFVNMEIVYLDFKCWEDFLVFNLYCYIDKDGKLIIF